MASEKSNSYCCLWQRLVNLWSISSHNLRWSLISCIWRRRWWWVHLLSLILWLNNASNRCWLTYEAGLLIDLVVGRKLIIDKSLLLCFHHIHSHSSLLTGSLSHKENAQHAASAHCNPQHYVPENKHLVVAATIVVLVVPVRALGRLRNYS